MKAKNWNLFVVGGTLSILVLLAIITMVIDPFLHYHSGQEWLEYPLKEERYQNDGIARHYEYDSIISGTSMCQNFKCSEFDVLWEAQSIKITLSGASYHELSNNIERALEYNEDVKYVVCSLDGGFLNYPADQDEYVDYPEYLYDNNPFNDVNYLLNKDVIPKTLAVLNYTRTGNKTVTMDEYGRWNQYKSFGRDSVMSSFVMTQEREDVWIPSEEDYQRVRDNVTENFLRLAQKYPDTTFYLFVSPYSICYWEALERTKQLEAVIDFHKIMAEVLLTADNIQLYDFSSRTEITGNLDNYTDTLHYGEWINSKILEMMHAGEGQLTVETYDDYYESLGKIYAEYDYSLYKE